MKNLEVKSNNFRYLLGRFKEWMTFKNYQPKTVKGYAEALQEFFNYLEVKHNIVDIQKVEQKHFTAFKMYLQYRESRNWGSDGGGIQNITINGIIKGVNCFSKHFNRMSDSFKLELYENYLPVDTPEKLILMPNEIMDMYHATFEPYPSGSIEMGQRDRVMIAIFYGCGIRLTEGSKLNISDIDFQNRQILVRYGKGKKERYVRIPNKHLTDIQEYIQQGRDWFKFYHHVFYKNVPKNISKADEDALFLSVHGTRMGCFKQRLNFLKQLAGIDKKVGTHTLRHSIGTHLLMKGWKLEQVSKLLGHASIDSTQVYTHIIEELKLTTYEE